MFRLTAFVLLTLPLTAAAAEAPLPEQILPPLPPVELRDLALVVAPDDPWITPAERTGLTTTPRYDDTVAYLRRLSANAPQIDMVSLGRSAEDRDIWMVVASSEGAATPQALLDTGKPILFAHAGIHSGEIDGKDAGLMLLRDMTVAGKRGELLDKANFLFIPILNVDGHERFSAYGRLNQRGPAELGWRTNARNQNLNRDFAKLETAGVRAVVAVINEWQPDLYVDLHVTDGVDYQYDVTFGFNGTHAWSPAIAGWLERFLEPATMRDLRERGHVPGPLIFAENYRDYAAGISDWTASPRYSNGYGDARHLAAVLVENHSLKPYLQRVLGTYVLLESMLDTLGEHGDRLRKATRADRKRRTDKVVLSWVEEPGRLPETMMFEGVSSHREYSPIAGKDVVRWSGVPEESVVIVRANDQPGEVVARPAHYYIPSAWGHIAARLQAHGIVVTHAGDRRADETVAVERYRLPQAAAASAPNPFEGRMRVDPGAIEVEPGELVLAAGDYIVSTDQPLGTLAMLLLEPASPDSLFQWGYFLEILNRTEYFEEYAAEPLAAAMMRDDPELARRFRDKLAADEDFAADPKARLHWFYEQSPYHDARYRLYPVARSVN